MRQFVRLEAPDIIKENWERIGTEYAAKRLADPFYRFIWPQILGKKVNHEVLPSLKTQTGNHCSYCDKYPLLRGDESIDHFKPKTDSRFYLEVCQWQNLYLACKHCQDSKATRYSEELLRPDDIHFRFTKYFVYNYNEHKIEPNPAATTNEKAMAEETIRTFNLNHPGMKISRRHAHERYRSDAAPDLNDYNFRFIFEL